MMSARHDMLSAYGSNPASLKDRTAEFQQLIAAQTSGGSTYISPRERLLQGGASGPISRVGTPSSQTGVNGQSSQGLAKTPKGEFARRAQAIGKDISDTTGKLGRLAQRESFWNVVVIVLTRVLTFASLFQ
jgi:Syntaxin-5 N-terminal, Sly1p-binding domain